MDDHPTDDREDGLRLGQLGRRHAEDVLREVGMDHVFVGGVTVLAFGMPRTTTDVDVIAAVTAGKVPKIVEGFRRAGFAVSAQDLYDALVEGGCLTVHDSRSVYRIDLVPARTDAHSQALHTKRRVAWRGRRLPFAAPERTIVMKLRWGIEQDLEDALAIHLRQKARLNLRMMRSFARDAGVARALRDLEARARDLTPRWRLHGHNTYGAFIVRGAGYGLP